MRTFVYFIVCLFLLGILMMVIFGKESNPEVSTSQIVGSQPVFTPDNIGEFYEGSDYGVNTDGAFFIDSNLIKGGNALLIIPETDSTKFKSSIKLEGVGYVREIVRMQRKGDYYYAKPTSKK